MCCTSWQPWPACHRTSCTPQNPTPTNPYPPHPTSCTRRTPGSPHPPAPQTATDTGRGKVLANTPRDRVFVYFSDHGAPGVLGMPAGPFLYADQLNDVIRHRSRVHGFKEMVVYIEVGEVCGCEG